LGYALAGKWESAGAGSTALRAESPRFFSGESGRGEGRGMARPLDAGAPLAYQSSRPAAIRIFR
jgi:hypothetical protein